MHLELIPNSDYNTYVTGAICTNVLKLSKEVMLCKRHANTKGGIRSER